VFNEIQKVIIDWGVQELFHINKTEATITCANGYQIYFVGLDDVEKIKSITPEKGVITDIWIEEATECDEKTVIQLYKRQRGGDDDTPKRLTLSFNPILQSHWIYRRYFKNLAWADDQTVFCDDELSILKTWHIHNRFLTQADHDDLENEQDPYYYNVYTRGGWGILGNVIFTNWVIADLNDPNSEHYLPENLRTNRRNGLDFGFSIDPAALFVSHYEPKKKYIYIYNELYEAGLTNDVLAVEVKSRIENDLVKCDSAEPKSIRELQMYGVNAKGARKGKDSVIFGIQWFQQQTIIIDKHCINAINEFQQYKWKEDKDGNAIRQPVDKMNHLIDAGRYAYEDDAIIRPQVITQSRW
jgi:phage terminase large subunit